MKHIKTLLVVAQMVQKRDTTTSLRKYRGWYPGIELLTSVSCMLFCLVYTQCQHFTVRPETACRYTVNHKRTRVGILGLVGGEGLEAIVQVSYFIKPLCYICGKASSLCTVALMLFIAMKIHSTVRSFHY